MRMAERIAVMRTVERVMASPEGAERRICGRDRSNLRAACSPPLEANTRTTPHRRFRVSRESHTLWMALGSKKIRQTGEKRALRDPACRTPRAPHRAPGGGA